jgi:hypothetical protein
MNMLPYASFTRRHARQASLSAVLAGGLVVAALVVVLGGGAPAQAATKYQFITMDNPGDLDFNQLLGINNYAEIVGYFGDGSAHHPNKGYILIPMDHYASENFPGSIQTQVIGISSDTPSLNFPTSFRVTVGFWVDQNGNQSGFVNRLGVYDSVVDPHTGGSNGSKVNNLLGVNAQGVAAGFYNDAKGNSHGYTYDILNQTYAAISLPFSGVQSFQATGINDSDAISGFYVDGKGTHGFYGTRGHFKSVDANVKGAAGTAFFGLNNNGILAGAVTVNGVSHGLIYDSSSNKSTVLDDPNQSNKTAFGVNGTFINGINDNEAVVGFYSDGTKVHGFFAAK